MSFIFPTFGANDKVFEPVGDDRFEPKLAASSPSNAYSSIIQRGFSGLLDAGISHLTDKVKTTSREDDIAAALAEDKRRRQIARNARNTSSSDSVKRIALIAAAAVVGVVGITLLVR